MVHYTPTEARARSVSVLSIHAGPSLECCVASMDGISLLGWLCNGLSTLSMPSLVHKEGSQHMYGWLGLMVHHTTSMAEGESAPVFIHLPMVYPLDVVWSVWM